MTTASLDTAIGPLRLLHCVYISCSGASVSLHGSLVTYHRSQLDQPTQLSDHRGAMRVTIETDRCRPQSVDIDALRQACCTITCAANTRAVTERMTYSVYTICSRRHSQLFQFSFSKKCNIRFTKAHNLKQNASNTKAYFIVFGLRLEDEVICHAVG